MLLLRRTFGVSARRYSHVSGLKAAPGVASQPPGCRFESCQGSQNLKGRLRAALALRERRTPQLAPPTTSVARTHGGAGWFRFRQPLIPATDCNRSGYPNSQNLRAAGGICSTLWTERGVRCATAALSAAIAAASTSASSTLGLIVGHLGSRKVFVSPSTLNPTDEWMRQQARNVSMWAEEEGIDVPFLIHDRDTKSTEAFD